MGLLDRFERGVENAVSTAFSKTSRSGVKPVEIASALRKEADARAAVVDLNRTVIPNQYDVRLSSADHAAILAWGEDTLRHEFEDAIRDHAEFQRYAFAGTLSVRFLLDESLPTGRFDVASRSTRGFLSASPRLVWLRHDAHDVVR